MRDKSIPSRAKGFFSRVRSNYRSLREPIDDTVQAFLNFAQSAFAARLFDAIIQRVSELPEEARRFPVVLAWLGRAQFERGAVAEARCRLAEAIALSSYLPDWVKLTLQDAAWKDNSDFSEEIPALLRSEMETFGRVIDDLISRGEASGALLGERFTSATLAMYWVKRGIRTVELDAPHQDATAKLLSLELNKDFLAAASEGANKVAEVCAALSTDVPFARQADAAPRVFDIASAVVLRAKPLLCPFTGQRGLARDSIDLYAYRYVHDGRACLTLGDGTAARAASDSAWYFPGERLLLVATGWDALPRVLAQVFLRAFENRAAVADYLADTAERPILVTDAFVGHLGHYIWNVISGWSPLFSRVPAERIDIITTHRPLQIFGGVKELYPDYTQRAGALIEVDGEADAYRIMLERHALGFTLLNNYITEDLARRVIDWCRRHCSPAFIAGVAEARKAADPLLLVTLRLENRAWVEQEDGLPRIFDQLAQDFPRLGVVLDGLNADTHSLDTHAYMSLDEEQRLARHIIESCPGVRIHNSIGCTPAESIVWCDTINAFLAPVGAGMAKYRWITNKPGVAYSNETCLKPNSHDGHLYDWHRENVVPMEYISGDEVKDVEVERHGLKFRANFSLDWEVLYAKIRDYLIQNFGAHVQPSEQQAIYPVEQISGIWHMLAGKDGAVPIRLGGQPVSEFQPGWKPRFVYTGFKPLLFLELVHENGVVTTWFLDHAMNRIAGRVDELGAEALQHLRRGLRSGLDRSEAFSRVNKETADAVQRLLIPTPLDAAS